MFSFINNINTLQDLFAAAKRSSCPESGGVVWTGVTFEPGSCLMEDQIMASQFNTKLFELLNNINKGA